MTAPIPHCGGCTHPVREPSVNSDPNVRRMMAMGWHNCKHLQHWQFFHDKSRCAVPDKFTPKEA